MKYKGSLKNVYDNHKGNAKFRGIPFTLSFDEWRAIWRKSRRYPLRGNRGGRYVMARFGDTGPYSPNNVRIILFENNLRGAKIGKPRPDLAAFNRSRLGIPLSREHRDKISKGFK